MRFIDIVAFVLLIGIAAIGRTMDFGGPAPEGPQVRRPPPAIAYDPPDRAAERRLENTSASDPGFSIKVDHVGNSTGTAFSIDQGGRWLTARHVIEGCTRVIIRTGPRKGMRVTRIVSHPNADLSVLWTGNGAPALPLSDADLKYGQDGFHFGFPKGKPGAVYSHLLGRRNMRISGLYRTSEPVIAWSQRVRVPDFGPDLGGISGGPVLNNRGGVIGVTVAGAPRRGRAYTSAPLTIAQLVQRARVTVAHEPPGARPEALLTQAGFSRHGKDLRAKLTVAQVICLVDKPGRRGRRPRI